MVQLNVKNVLKRASLVRHVTETLDCVLTDVRLDGRAGSAM